MERAKGKGLFAAAAACLTMALAATGAVQETEPNDVAPQALGAVAAPTTIVVEGSSEYSGDIDWYAFDIESDTAQRVRLAVESAVSWQIVLYSDDLRPLSSGTDSLTLELSPGGYRARVQSSDLGRESYVLFLSNALETETNDGLAEATNLGVVQTLPLTAFASIDPAGDIDFFSFDVAEDTSADPAPGTVRVLRIDTPCPTGDTLVVLYAKTAGREIAVPVARNDDWGDASWSRLYLADPAPGRYTLRVHEYSDSEAIPAYRVVVTPMTVADTEPNDPPLATPLGELAPQGWLGTTQFLGEDDTDAFSFTVTSPVCVQIETSGILGGDTVLALYDVTNDRDVASDDDGGDGLWSRLFCRLEPGRYEVGVWAADERDQFDYTLTLRTASCPSAGSEEEPNNSVASATPVVLPCDVTAEISSDDPDCFRFVLSSAAMVIAETYGDGQTDTVLCILDSNGKTVVCNDDGGSGLWSRIERDLVPGTYTVRVELYGGATARTYHLLLRTDESVQRPGEAAATEPNASSGAAAGP